MGVYLGSFTNYCWIDRTIGPLSREKFHRYRCRNMDLSYDPQTVKILISCINLPLSAPRVKFRIYRCNTSPCGAKNLFLDQSLLLVCVSSQHT